MIYLVLSIGLFVILLFVLGITEEKKWRLNKKMILSVFAFLLVLPGMIVKVDANETGVLYDPFNGGIQNRTLDEGIHFKSLFTEVKHVSTTNRTANLSVAGQTFDAIYAVFEITLVYYVDTIDAASFYRRAGNTTISAEQLNSLTKEILQSVTTQFDIYEVLGNQLEEVRSQFVTALSTTLKERYNVTVVSGSFDDIDAGSRIEEIIQNKAEAIQMIEIAEQEKQRAEVEALTAIIRAENESEVAKIRAEGNAEAQIILNSVTVNAIKQMYVLQFEESQDTSTPEVYGYLTIQEIAEIIVKQLYYDTWDGKLPEVITDGTGIIINP